MSTNRNQKDTDYVLRLGGALMLAVMLWIGKSVTETNTAVAQIVTNQEHYKSSIAELKVALSTKASIEMFRDKESETVRTWEHLRALQRSEYARDARLDELRLLLHAKEENNRIEVTND